MSKVICFIVTENGKLFRCLFDVCDVLNSVTEVLQSLNVVYHSMENIHGQTIEMYHDISGGHKDRNYRMEQKTGRVFRGPVIVLLRHPLVPSADQPYLKQYDSFNYRNNKEEEFSYHMTFESTTDENVSEFMNRNGDLPATPIQKLY